MSRNAADFPRVLVVTSNNFNLRSGGGITLTNLFSDWPAECLANVHEDSASPDESVCTKYFRLTGQEVHWSGALALLERPLTGRGRQEGTTAVAQTATRRGLKRWMIGDGLPRSFTLTSKLEQWLEEFRPQLVYGFLGSIAQIRVTRAIVDRWQLPLALHIMDDWPATLYSRGFFAPLLRRMMLREFGQMLDRAQLRLAISDGMAHEYERRYGGSFQVFHNALRTDEWLNDARREWSLRTPARVGYVGSILAAAQRDAIHDACEAIAHLRAAGRDVTLTVHAPSSQTGELTSWRYPREVLQIEPEPQPRDVPGLMAAADVLLLPFNFDNESARYLRFSMPTKVPAYMISGTPILLYGPRQLAAVSYAADAGWGQVVSARGAHNIASALVDLLDDEPRRRTLGQRAQRIAREFHDIARVREEFRNALRIAARVDASPRKA